MLGRFVKVNQQVFFADVKDLAETNQLIVLHEPMVQFDPADELLVEIDPQQLHLRGKLFLGHLLLFAQPPQILGDQIGVFVEAGFIHRFYPNTKYFLDFNIVNVL
jgi:hypothetical protein